LKRLTRFKQGICFASKAPVINYGSWPPFAHHASTNFGFEKIEKYKRELSDAFQIAATLSHSA
jgi:hypothetical protein